MHRVIDLSGMRFGRLTVLSRENNDNHGGTRWLCRCDCGNSCIVDSGNLRHGRQKSCGCLRHREPWNKTHGEFCNSRLYRIWTGMKTRCYDKRCKAYPSYGGRGIFICEDWKDNYESFRDWALLNGYSDDLSIDRIDNDQGYFPENCSWATRENQSNNRRSSRFVVLGGIKMTTARAARELGVDYHTYMKRIYREATSC